MTGFARRLLSLSIAALCAVVASPMAVAGQTAPEAPAAAPGDLAGTYATHMMETASALELTADGRFRWYLSVGALDLAAEGRWTRTGDQALILNSEPAFRAPRFELTGTRREAVDGVAVIVTDAEGRTPDYLDAQADYAGGTSDGAHVVEGRTVLASTRGRPIVAIRVGSGPFDFISERYRVVPGGDNVFQFRFFANDVGRADFRDLAVAIDGAALTFSWRGTDWRYERADRTADESALSETSGDGSGSPEASAADGSEGAREVENWTHCRDEGLAFALDVAIAGCTALIEAGSLSQEERGIVHFNRGNLRVDAGDAAGAVGDYDRALEIDPENGSYHAGRAAALTGLGDFRRALVASREAVRLSPEDPNALSGLCWNLAVLGEELDAARRACDTALRIAPGTAATLDSRGLIGLRQSRFQEAWNDYDAAVRAEPEEASFLFGRGVAAVRLGRAGQGQADMERATAIEAGIAQTYAGFGITP